MQARLEREAATAALKKAVGKARDTRDVSVLTEPIQRAMSAENVSAELLAEAEALQAEIEAEKEREEEERRAAEKAEQVTSASDAAR